MIVIRRKFLGLIAAAGVIFVVSLFGNYWVFRKIFYRIEDFFRKPKKLSADIQRIAFEIPRGGYSVSVELALNSRCTSDYDGNQCKFHWGMFDETKKLSDEQINRIVTLAKIPRFTDGRVEIRKKDNMLTFVIESEKAAILNDWMMVESGMQQQAIGLVCAAMGVGVLFNNLGKDGTKFSSNVYGTVIIRIDAMKPSYNSSFWCSLAPIGRSPWIQGNLIDPIRKGDVPLISALENLTTERRSSKRLTEESISQLLWAARGRTPHLYKSKPWGMTIPVWGGESEISTVYLIKNGKLWKYLNWKRNRPTHSLLELKAVSIEIIDWLLDYFRFGESYIVLGRNDNHARALWEIGYQLFNLLVQGYALGISYTSVLLNEEQKKMFSEIGIKEPVGVLAI